MSHATTAIMNTYGRLPVEFVKGDGVYLFNRDNERYLDALSGIGVCALGHCHPAVTAAITEQANTLLHTSNLYHIEKQQQLAEKLCDASGMSNVFFGNSGAEANEAAIKMARLYGNQQGIDEPSIIVFEQSFHGRTLATLTATGNRKIQAGFEPLVKGFSRAPYNDLAAVKTLIKNNKQIVAILAEPIQGEGGLNVPDDNFLSELRTICDEHNLLLMLDEVQTGNGRTGQYFAYQHSGILPDVVTTAKGLGNGVPIGACLAQGKASELLVPGTHGSTYGGNPLVCAAALATVNTLTGGVIDNAANMGDYLQNSLRENLSDNPLFKEVRGKGLMIGIALTIECTELVAQALENKLLINVTAGSVIRLLPPLVLSKDEADIIVKTITSLVNALAASQVETVAEA